MFALLYLLGWIGTVVLVFLLWGAGSQPTKALAVLGGLAVGLLWPITLWIAAGVWWRRRAASPARDLSPAVRPSLVGTTAVCAVGSVLTFVGLSAVASPPPPASLTSSTLPASAAPSAEPVVAPAPLLVVEVVDGDTVGLSDGRQVRVLGIDAPELGECGYTQATEFASTSLLNRPVQVTADPTQASIDQYGRALLYIDAPRDYSTVIASVGWAEYYVFDGKPVQRAVQIEAGQRAAQSQRLGIWGSLCAPAPTTPPASTEQPPPAVAQEDDDRGLAAPAPEPEPRPQPEPRPAPEPDPEPDPAPAAGSDCHPSYVPCVPNGPDLDCGEIGYAVRVVGPDDFNLDGDDNDGQGCESYG